MELPSSVYAGNKEINVNARHVNIVPGTGSSSHLPVIRHSFMSYICMSKSRK